MKKFFGFLFLLGIAIGCNSDGDTTPTPTGPVDVFKISAEANAFSSDATWFVAWDDDGTLLDYGKFVDGQTITLTTEEEITNNKATLGYFRTSTNGSGFVSTSITIYTDLAPGTEVKFGTALVSRPSPGKFKVTVLNLPSSPSTYLSNKNGLASGISTTEIGKTTFDVFMAGDDHKYITAYLGDPLSYQEINDVDPDDEFEIDYNDFKPYEKTSKINLPSEYDNARVFFRGLEADQALNTGFNVTPGFYLSNKLYESGPEEATEATVGYFPSITQFLTAVTANYKDATVIYTKYGALPGTITWPNPTKYTVTSKDPNSFAVSVGDQVEYITGNWYNAYDEGYFDELLINSPKLSPRIGAVPAEMITAHSRFEIKKERYPDSGFEFVTKGSQPYLENFAALVGRKTVVQEKTVVAFY